jgi:hypothetical protein
VPSWLPLPGVKEGVTTADGRGGSYWGGIVGSMVREKEGAASMARQRERRRRRCSTSVVREEERSGGPKCRTRRRVTGPTRLKFERKFFSE